MKQIQGVSSVELLLISQLCQNESLLLRTLLVEGYFELLGFFSSFVLVISSTNEFIFVYGLFSEKKILV